MMLPDSPGCLKVPTGPRTLPCALCPGPPLVLSPAGFQGRPPPPPSPRVSVAPDLAQVRWNYSRKFRLWLGGPPLVVSAALANRPDKGVVIVGPGPPPALWPETGGSCQPSPLAAACPSEQVSAARRPPCLRAHTRPLRAHSLEPQPSRVPPLPMVSACLSLVTQRPPWRGLQPPPPRCRDPSPPPPPGGTSAPQPHRVRPQPPPPTSLVPLLSQMPFLLCVGRAFTHCWGEAWGGPLRQGAPPDCRAGPSGLLAWTHRPVHQAGVGPKDTSWQGRRGHRFRAPGTFPARWSVVCGTAGGGLRGQW